MTNDHNSKLRVDFYDPDPSLVPSTVYGIFSYLKISSEADKYRSLITGLLKILICCTNNIIILKIFWEFNIEW